MENFLTDEKRQVLSQLYHQIMLPTAETDPDYEKNIIRFFTLIINEEEPKQDNKKELLTFFKQYRQFLVGLLSEPEGLKTFSSLLISQERCYANIGTHVFLALIKTICAKNALQNHEQTDISNVLAIVFKIFYDKILARIARDFDVVHGDLFTRTQP